MYICVLNTFEFPNDVCMVGATFKTVQQVKFIVENCLLLCCYLSLIQDGPVVSMGRLTNGPNSSISTKPLGRAHSFYGIFIVFRVLIMF